MIQIQTLGVNQILLMQLPRLIRQLNLKNGPCNLDPLMNVDELLLRQLPLQNEHGEDEDGMPSINPLHYTLQWEDTIELAS